MRPLLLFAVGLLVLPASSVEANELNASLQKLAAVGKFGEGHREAITAARQLVQADAADLPKILTAMDDASPLTANWFRGAVEAIVDRQLQRGGKLPAEELEQFVLDTRHAPLSRRLAFECLARVDATAPDRLIPGMLHDASVEFRREAVERLLKEAEPLFEAKRHEQVIPIYRQAFEGARDLEQIKLLAKRLRELTQPVDLPRHFGFVMQWKLIGPFDNTDKKGFVIAYPPEQQVDFNARYAGKAEDVGWIDHTTTDDYGVVDLNKALDKHMGAVGYAAAEFMAEAPRAVELRLASPNATRLWLNGTLIDEHEVYHAGSKIDQYIHRGRLVEGRNVILLKVCQNEQKDSWAQDWKFQLRVCDATGTAILALNRPASVPSAVEPPAESQSEKSMP